jgi:hypothetical protein
MKLDYRQRIELESILELAANEDELSDVIAKLIVDRDKAKEYEWRYKDLQR